MTDRGELDEDERAELVRLRAQDARMRKLIHHYRAVGWVGLTQLRKTMGMDGDADPAPPPKRASDPPAPSLVPDRAIRDAPWTGDPS
jgi:hypothetical protein